MLLIKSRQTLIALPAFIISLYLSLLTSAFASPVNINIVKDYAIFSALAYESAETVQRESSKLDYSATYFGNIAEINIRYYLLTQHKSKQQIIVVRGTANIENAIIDASVKLVNDPIAGVALHEGFAYSARRVYQQLKPFLKTDYTINTTGHSLGGAIASILAMYLDSDNYKTNMTITFGQPKITNITGANRYSHLHVLRVVTPADMVPLVPPFDPLNMSDLNIYWHTGTELVLNADNTYSILSGINSMMRAADFTQTIPNDRNLQNHQMRYYLSLIENKLGHGREVPYKSVFNLFNLFGNPPTLQK